MKSKVVEAESELDKKDKIKDNMVYVRASNIDLAILNRRSVAMNMPLSTYMMWRSLKPLGQLKKKKERQDLSRLDYEAYMLIRKELNKQGVNLNQIAKAINSARQEGKTVDGYDDNIKAIREANEAILASLVYLGEKS